MLNAAPVRTGSFSNLRIERFAIFRLIPLLAVVFVLLAACGGSSRTTVPTWVPTSTAPATGIPPLASTPVAFDLSPLELLKQSTEVMAAIKSFRSHTEIDGTVLGERVNISMDMELDGNNGMHSAMSVNGPDGIVTIEQIIKSPNLFINISGVGDGWMRMGIEEAAREAGVSVEVLTEPTEFALSLFPGDRVPWDLYTVRSAGYEVMDGIRTQRLTISVDFQELWERLDDEARRQLAQGMGPLGNSLIEDGMGSAEYKDIEIWIDDQGRMRRTVMSLLIGEEMQISTDMRLTDIDSSIIIEEPSDYQDLR